jgi:uncharacterized protein YecA (UPF0149 family)
MKKVIAVLPNGNQVIGSPETALKNKWWITYNVEVILATSKPTAEINNQDLPKTGAFMTGLTGHIYQLFAITPVHVCYSCHQSGTLAKGKNRVGNKFYCDSHFNGLVVTKPIKKQGTSVSRNELCTCGSGKKFKRCCYSKMTDHKPRHYFNSKYINNQ